MTCKPIVILRSRFKRSGRVIVAGKNARYLTITRMLLVILPLAVAGPLLAAQAPSSAGCAGVAYRAFDFWLGNWEVFLADGRRAGANRIEASDDGCFIREQWTGAGGSEGFSMNFYEPQADRWRQIWVSRDSIIEISGNLHEGSMVLDGDIRDRTSGEVLPFRGRWTPLEDGRVRQYFEERREDKWHPWFEGFYLKVVE